jgi:hypothetical protein
MRWSNYRSFTDVDWESIPDGPGVYYITCIDGSGNPLKVRRLGGTDAEGIIYIGETGRSLRNRLRGFWKSAQNYRQSRHVAGFNFSYYGYGSIFPLSGLQFSYTSCEDKSHSRRLEADCLWDYRRTKGFIDLPPLNFSGGKAD